MQLKKGFAYLWYIFVFLVVIITVQGFLYLKEQKLQAYQNSIYNLQVNKAHQVVENLIQEKQNDTMTLALSFAHLDSIKQALRDKTDPKEAVSDFSKKIRTYTKFKNPWFQLLDSEGNSLYRSWDEKSRDNVTKVRSDLEAVYKNHQPVAAISVGKYSMSFKAAVAVVGKDGEFLGVFEVITHFNSIAKELNNAAIKALFLADKRYKQQLEYVKNPIYLSEHLVTLLAPDKELLQYFEQKDIDSLMQQLKQQKYLISEKLNGLICYKPLYDRSQELIGHILIITPQNPLDRAAIEEIEIRYTIYMVFALIVEVGLFYLLGLFKTQKQEQFNKKNIAYLYLAIIVLNFAHYELLNYNYIKDMHKYNKLTLKQIENEFFMVYEKNKKLAEFIFIDDIDTKEVKKLFAAGDREKLYSYLEEKYALYRSMYSIRQLHFHTKDNKSFLRMHKPSKYGDSLAKDRQSVVWVNEHLQPFDGFEEGRIFNGFRYVFPLFNNDKVHIGSVEISFDGYSFIDNYLQNFDRERINLLIKEDVIDDKVMDSEKRNYIQSPVAGYLFDASIVAKLKEMGKGLKAQVKSPQKLQEVATKIELAKPFWIYFPNAREIVYGIPLKNKLTKQVVGSVQISQNDIYLQELKRDKWLYFMIGVGLSLLIAFIVYKESISKQKVLQLKQMAYKERDRAQQISKYKSEFLANMSHEIRTPLNAILGFVDLLKERINEPESKKYLQTIHSSSHHLLGVINDILDFSKLESGKLNVEMIDFNVKKEFMTIYQLFNAQVSEKDIDLVIKIDPQIPPVVVSDPLRIKQVITNLLSNAIKFTAEHKKIYLSIGYAKEHLQISVKDEGIGIEKQKLQQIFEAFSQADSSTTRRFGGTGLGLSISSELVRLLGGTLEVKSQKGRGSEFYFSIPAKAGKVTTQKEQERKEVSFKGKNVLLVEDNKANQVFMKVVLKKLQLDFELADDGFEAVRIFGEKRFDLILMDENMPNMNGIEATKQILAIENEKKQPHTPIIALTANALKGDREKFLNAGMDEYMTKPVDRKKLEQLLQQFFEKERE